MSRPKVSIDGLSSTQALAHIGDLINDAENYADDAQAEAALGLADSLEQRGIEAEQRPVLDYFRANAWGCLYGVRRQARDDLWAVEQPELQKQIHWLRKALYSDHIDRVHPFHRCQMLTNLGNQLNTVGRVVEAQAVWTQALAIDPKFWMARGNRGLGRWAYGRALADGGHAAVFLAHAHRDLAHSAYGADQWPQYGEPVAGQHFMAQASALSARGQIGEVWDDYQPAGWPMGESDAEKAYRQWALERTLFLNPLNDLGAESIAAADALMLPDFAAVPGEPPIIAGMFSELKQSFVSARWLLWEGTNADEPHVSDQGVSLYNTLDYAVFGLGTEKLKLAFRMAYSLFDKMAYFLNFYFDLGVKEHDVSFRSIWEGKKGAEQAQHASAENLPLRGLFWLSKDLFDPAVRDSPEPEAREIGLLRNHIEHKYVKIIEDWAPATEPGSLFHDSLAHTLTRTALEVRTVRLMQLARSALVYLVLAVHQHERQARPDDGAAVGALPLTTLPFDTRR